MASTDLEQLKIVLAVRDREFAKAMDRNTKRVDRFSRQSNKGLSKTTKSFNALSRAASMLLPAIGAAALTRAVSGVISSLDEIGKTADNLGLTTDALQELRTVAESSGMTFDEFTKGFQKFTVNIGEASTGMGEALGAFEMLGVELRTVTGELKSNEQVFSDVSDGLANISNESERASIAADLFGQRVGVKMLNLLRNGSDGMDEMREAARKLGIVIDEDLIRKAEAAQTELDLMSRVIKANLSTALINLAPLLVSTASHMANLSKFAAEFSQSMDGMGMAFQVVQLTDDVTSAEDALSGLRNTLSQLPESTDIGLSAARTNISDRIAAEEALLATAKERLAVAIELRNPSTTTTTVAVSQLDMLKESTLDYIDAMSSEREALGLTTAEQRKARIEVEAATLRANLRNAASADGTNANGEMEGSIQSLVETYISESMALDAAKNAIKATTGARRENVVVINEEEKAMLALEDANVQMVKDYIDIIAEAENLEDALNGVLKMALKLAATSFLQGLFGLDASAGSGSLGAFFNNAGASINGKASGGPVMAGQAYEVGEHGREQFVPAQNGRILSVAQSKDAVGGGGGVTVVQTINVTTGIQSTVRAEMVNMLPQIEAAAKNAVIQANQQGGSFRKSLMGG